MSMHARSKGFTLTELMITVALVGLLAAIAIPSYKSYVIRSNRADAESQLLQLGQSLERYYTANDSYTSTSGTLPSTTSLGYTQSPATGTPVYTLGPATGATQTATYYKIQATPVTTGINKTDGALTLDSVGTRTWDKNNNGTIDPDEKTWTQ